MVNLISKPVITHVNFFAYDLQTFLSDADSKLINIKNLSFSLWIAKICECVNNAGYNLTKKER